MNPPSFDGTIDVVFQGEPPWQAELFEDVKGYEFTQPHVVVHHTDGSKETRDEVLFVRTRTSKDD